MNTLPEEVKDKIYKYKHQLEYKLVMDELLLHRLNTAFNLTLDMVEMMLPLFSLPENVLGIARRS